jgi:tryptophan-rich sensory protein
VAILIAAAAFEGLCAGKNPMAQLKALKQPPWSPPTGLWVAIGLIWYGLCLVALLRLLPLWRQDSAPVLLLVLLMLANGAANLFQFRLRRLDLALLFQFPYAVLLAAFLWRSARLDPAIPWLFSPYCLYLPFAALWAWRLWRMNPR